LVQAVEQHAGELLRRHVRRQIGAADVANEQCVAGEHRERLVAAVEIGDGYGYAFYRVAGRFQEAENDAQATPSDPSM
jgi:hypothetical protein